MNKYDLIIIGAGPSGLGLAKCVCKLNNKKILILDKESVIGGCHRVRRVNGLFTEHGPRIYSTTYKVFNKLLKEMNVEFKELFKEYNFTITQIGGETVFTTLEWRELILLGIELFKLMINKNTGINISMEDFLRNNNFKEESIEIIDRVCKLTDGGGIEKYTLNQFLQLFNQQILHKLYQPNKPLDEGLFKIWKEYLEKNGVEFSLNIEIEDIKIDNGKIENIKIRRGNDNFIINGDKYVFAIPPKNLNEIVKKYDIKNDWGDLERFSKETEYIDYISVTFHWNKKLELNKIYGFPKTEWGLAYIVLTDYMEFKEENSKTVISSAVTITDRKSKNNNKTANECNKEELLKEMMYQLRQSFPEIPEPSISLISSGVIYDENEKKWKSLDTAFISNSKEGFLKYENNVIKNMYNLGTHNGNSYYKFTSMESAVSNSVALSKILYKELNNKKYIELEKAIEISDIFDVLIIILIIYFIYIIIKE